VDLGRDRQSVDHDRMDGAVTRKSNSVTMSALNSSGSADRREVMLQNTARRPRTGRALGKHLLVIDMRGER
jgi:hypothetical protein